MNARNNPATEWKIVAVLFILVLITFSVAEHDSKRAQSSYNLAPDKKTVLTVVKQATSVWLR